MKNNIKLLSILISLVICLQFVAKSVFSEPFVVLAYRNNSSKSFEVSDNPFLKNENFSKKYKVKKKNIEKLITYLKVNGNINKYTNIGNVCRSIKDKC